MREYGDYEAVCLYMTLRHHQHCNFFSYLRYILILFDLVNDNYI